MDLRRNRRFIALAFALSVAATGTPQAALAKDESTLRALELQRFAAQVDADADVLARLLHDDLEYAHSNGDLDTKKSFIDSLTSGKRDYAATVATIESIRVFKGFAIIRGTAKVTVIDGGASRDLHLGFTDVWVDHQGKWQMTAWRSARLPDAPAK